MESILEVDGMSCAHCVKAIQTAVGGLSGVANVAVDLRAKTVTVAHDPSQITVDTIRKVIEEQGYDVIG